jgi:hypothetical protein
VNDLDSGFGIRMPCHIAKQPVHGVGAVQGEGAVHGKRRIRGTVDYVREERRYNFD